MSGGTEASILESFIEGESVVRMSGPTPEPDLDGVELIFTLPRTLVLVRGQEVHEFPNRDELAHFLWAECETRVDSLMLLYGMKLLRVVTGPVLTCRAKSVDSGEASAA